MATELQISSSVGAGGGSTKPNSSALTELRSMNVIQVTTGREFDLYLPGHFALHGRSRKRRDRARRHCDPLVRFSWTFWADQRHSHIARSSPAGVASASIGRQSID